MNFNLEILPSVIISIIALIALTGLLLVLFKREWIAEKVLQFRSNAYTIVTACTIILSLSAFLISIYILYCCGCYGTEKCCNSDSIVVGAFGVIVTLLIGWNIYKTINIDKMIEKWNSDRGCDCVKKLAILLTSARRWAFFDVLDLLLFENTIFAKNYILIKRK